LRISKRHHHHHRQQRETFHVTHTHLLASDLLILYFSIPEAPFQSLYVLERDRRRKVAAMAVADFSHPG
jgi:hypothetical protein